MNLVQIGPQTESAANKVTAVKEASLEEEEEEKCNTKTHLIPHLGEHQLPSLNDTAASTTGMLDSTTT